MAFLDQIAISTLPLIPTPIMRRLAGRYISGETLEQALERMRDLKARGFPSAVDLLGEDVQDESGARAVAAEYREISEAVKAQGLDAYVSIKPTHVGLNLSEELCFELYDQVLRHAAGLGLDVRVEMEDHPTTEGTLRVFERLRAVHSNVGIVLQSRLHRTPEDIERLLAGPSASDTPLWVRMVKGIYLEPASIAFTDPDPIRDAYVRLSERLLGAGARVGFATHDELMAQRLLDIVAEQGVAKERYEFQVLLGVRESLWDLWASQGHTVRVYVPFGPQWRPYSLRRLKHNPEIFRHLVRDTLRLNKR
jgi:proline dehydrogenase